MKHQELTRLSKYLSLILRHRPEVANIQLDENGWTSVAELLNQVKDRGKAIDQSTLKTIVENDNKQRYAFSEDGLYIRANQGHSVKVDLGYKAMTPPTMLYHGTAEKFISNIRHEGLKKRTRHHVHLSAELATAKNVGSRHGNPVILIVKAKEMSQSGYDFFLSNNGVWLTDHVPVEYIEFPL